MTARTVKDYRQQSLQYLVPALGAHKIRDVTRRDVEAMVEPLTNVRRNRVLALASRLFTLFETWEWRPQNTNPARGIERAREEPRDRTFSETELAAFALALKDAEERYPAPVAAVRLAAVTGLRIGRDPRYPDGSTSISSLDVSPCRQQRPGGGCTTCPRSPSPS